MNQGRGLQGLPGFFLGQLPGRQGAQLLVDQRQELLRGGGIALVNRIQDLGDFGHAP
jgi:hypothetical protein